MLLFQSSLGPSYILAHQWQNPFQHEKSGIKTRYSLPDNSTGLEQ